MECHLKSKLNFILLSCYLFTFKIFIFENFKLMLKYIFKKSLEEHIGESCYQVSKLTIKFMPLSRVTLACHYYSTLIEQSSVDEVISLQLIKINEKKKKETEKTNKQTK